MDPPNQDQSITDIADNRKTGATIAGGLAAIDLALLIQVLPALQNLSSSCHTLLWLSILILSACIPALTFIFGSYAVMPRKDDGEHFPIKKCLFLLCIASGFAISLAIAAFHFLAGVVFLILSIGGLAADIHLEKKNEAAANQT